jgi:hypothetical protein
VKRLSLLPGQEVAGNDLGVMEVACIFGVTIALRDMARNWIKIETVTCDKPEVCVVATQLKVDPDMVVGKLVRLWSWAEVNRINGNEMNVTFEFIDKLVGKKGFAAALAKAGWLLEVGEKLQFPNFDRHNGPNGKGRALTAQRVSRHRERKRDGNEGVTSLENGSDAGARTNSEVKPKPRNVRRNTVKELIQSEQEHYNTPITEIIIPAEIPPIEVAEASKELAIQGSGQAEVDLAVPTVNESQSGSAINAHVTNQKLLDDEFSNASEVDDEGRPDSTNDESVTTSDISDDEFGNDHATKIDAVSESDSDSVLDAVNLNEGDVSGPDPSSEVAPEAGAESEFESESELDTNEEVVWSSEEEESSKSSSAPDLEPDTITVPDESPAPKGRKGLGGVVVPRKVIVPETPEQPLLF